MADAHFVETVYLGNEGPFAKIGDRFNDGSLRNARWVKSEAEVAVLDPKLEQRLEVTRCVALEKRNEIKTIANGLQLKPINRRSLYEFILESLWINGLTRIAIFELSNNIADHFAAPQPKRERITVTPEQGEQVTKRYDHIMYVKSDGNATGTPQVSYAEAMAQAIEHVLNEEQGV